MNTTRRLVSVYFFPPEVFLHPPRSGGHSFCGGFVNKGRAYTRPSISLCLPPNKWGVFFFNGGGVDGGVVCVTHPAPFPVTHPPVNGGIVATTMGQRVVSTLPHSNSFPPLMIGGDCYFIYIPSEGSSHSVNTRRREFHTPPRFVSFILFLCPFYPLLGENVFNLIKMYLIY